MKRPRTWAEEEVARIHDRSARRAASQAATYRYLYAGPRRRSRLKAALFWLGMLCGLIGIITLAARQDGAAGFLMAGMLGGIFGDPRG